MGLTAYMKQQDISLLTCLLSLVSAIIASVEMYLGINRQMEEELFVSKSFQILSYDIYKTLQLEREHRVDDGHQYLTEKYNQYIKLIEHSNPVKDTRKSITDTLAPIPDSIKPPITPSSSENASFGMAMVADDI